MQPARYSTDSSKIAFVISLLTEKALRWAFSIWNQNGLFLNSYRIFSEYFQEVLGFPEGDSSVSDELYNIKQGKASASDYSLH